MKPNDVKTRINSGEVSLGTFAFEFNTTGIGRLASGAGAEFIVYDMEHTGWTIETIRMLIATTPKDKCVPMVRVPTTEYDFVARALDMGAMGIMVPMVENAEQAATIAAAAKYPPLGRRGAAFGISHDDYEGSDILETIASANRESLLIAQIETVQGLNNIDAIAQVEGIDVLWIGHFDLTNSMGIPGQFDHPNFKSAVSRVAESCRERGKIGGFMASDAENARWLIDQGFTMIALGGDLWLYQQALSTQLRAVRGES